MKALDNFFKSNNNPLTTNFISTDTLNKIFANEADLSSLIQTILSQKPGTAGQKARQYRDLSLCLNLLDRKIANLPSLQTAPSLCLIFIPIMTSGTRRGLILSKIPMLVPGCRLENP